MTGLAQTAKDSTRVARSLTIDEVVVTGTRNETDVRHLPMTISVVNRKVLENCNIDPDEYVGFAFGVGLERIALLKYEIDDMRLLYENDKRFLEQV